jgi:glucoamylase
MTETFAPGWPGIEPRWTSSAKSGVGTALTLTSRLWFALSHGILDEVYYPRVDQACTRDLGLIVTDGANFFSEEKRHTRSEVACLAADAPAYRLTNICHQGRYCIEKEIITDPMRDSLLQWTRFTTLQTGGRNYHLYVLLAPHLGNRGRDNTGWVGDYKGIPMLFAQRADCALALACSAPWLARSVGFVGVSDAWQDLSKHGRLTTLYTRAEHGNVALAGEIALPLDTSGFVLALAFGATPAEAGHHALASLQDGFEAARARYLRQWQDWQASLQPSAAARGQARPHFATSMAVMRSHEAKSFPGGLIASLSIPWGFAKGDDDLGGYHLVWPRDLVEAAGGLLAGGACDDVRRILQYLQATQEADGRWPQNMWLDGTPFWGGVQMDETGFPILLVDLARREGALLASDLARFWPMVRRAARFLLLNGPVSQEDRWEEDPGYSPFTLAVEIAALLAAADLAERQNEMVMATYLRETADAWNANVERWCYVTGGDLAQQVGVDGYYVRITPPDEADASSPLHGFVPIKNRPPGESQAPADQIISPDALALVRFGLRAADDPRILNTVRVIDAFLKAELPAGPSWYRYTNDGYGEHADGSPFDGTGIGRPWPLLTGERGHYELAAGRPAVAEQLLQTLEAFANGAGLLPEQLWDAPDLPERELFLGRPSGSAMPLVWAHAEYVKLCRSLADNRIFDQPPQTVQRYLVDKIGSPYACWRYNHKRRRMAAGQRLRIELAEPGRVHWSADDWQTIDDIETRETGLGPHVADLPTEELLAGATIRFTFYWLKQGRWAGEDFQIQVVATDDNTH